MSSCRSDGVFVLYRLDGGQRVPIGWYDIMAEAICALEEERAKEDGTQLEIRQENVKDVRLDQR